MNKFIVMILLFVSVFTLGIAAAAPYGANYSQISSSNAPVDPADSHDAIAGNLTELDVTGFSTTQSWQGYFGNVSGAIELANAAGDTMYNWSLASPQGEIYATTDTSVAWADVACFDLAGNHSTVESAFNVGSADADGLNETFSDSTSHDEFFTNNVQFTAGLCAATNIFDSTGGVTASNFQEVLLTDSSAAGEIIFAAILDDDVAGFDDNTHDFEMLVLEDGHGTDTSTTAYYFYVELE